MDLLRDAVAFLSDAYWATGFLVVLGGFVLFIGEVISHRGKWRAPPRVVNIFVERSPEPPEYAQARLADRASPLELGPPPAALPVGTAPREDDSAGLDAPGKELESDGTAHYPPRLHDQRRSTMALWLTVAAAVVLGVVFAVVIFAVLYRAVSNVFDWVVATFGNDPGRSAR